MMKRILVFFLALLLAVPGLVALGEEDVKAQTIRSLNALVEEFLKKNEYSYDFDDDVFLLDFTLESALSACEMEIRVYFDAIEVLCTPAVRAKEENREKLALLTTLINYDIFYGHLGMRLETGAFYSRGMQLVETVLPGIDEVGVLVHMPLNYLDDYGDGLAQVALFGADPYETYAGMKDKE